MSEFHKHPEWPFVLEIIQKLTTAGFQAWLAGGCVRDMLLGIQAKDFDIATNAKPNDVAALYPEALTVGREFGVTIIPFTGFQVEVATFRKDGPYSDGRRPENIEFSSAEQDAKRRDFTVNGLFYDPVGDHVYDYVEGQKDLKLRILRAVGDPFKRFEEDKLRLLRAVRFQAQLGFEIEARTLSAIQQMSGGLSVVSAERIWAELKKLSSTVGRGQGTRLLFDSGLMHSFWPELSNWFKIDTERTEQIFAALMRLPQTASPLAFWTVLLGDFNDSEKLVKLLLRRLKASNQEADEILSALGMYQTINREHTELYTKIQLASEINFETVLRAQEALKGAAFGKLSAEFAHIRDEYLGGRFEMPEALIGGTDLIQQGVRPGPEFSRLLNECYKNQVLNKIADRSKAVQFLTALLSE